ncbi:hypothetical protein [Acinetobacter sp.]|uniref:hypothetical protein n=1 Tax=Acinetobacter sp. TaxID=472 RepID=UPI003D08E2C2
MASNPILYDVEIEGLLKYETEYDPAKKLTFTVIDEGSGIPIATSNNHTDTAYTIKIKRVERGANVIIEINNMDHIDNTLRVKIDSYRVVVGTPFVITSIAKAKADVAEELAQDGQEQTTTEYLKRDMYYCGANAKVYINPDDEIPISIIQWSAGRNYNPLYGYRSYTYDDTMGGQYLVQGGIAMPLESAFKFTQNLGTLKDTSGVMGDGSVLLSTQPFTLNVAISLDNKLNEIYKLESVHITGMSHQVSADGQVVGENYEFIARRATGN